MEGPQIWVMIVLSEVEPSEWWWYGGGEPTLAR